MRLMKLRHPRLIRVTAYFAAKLIRVWIWTLRYTYCPLGPDVRPQIARPDERYIYVFWHENLLLLAYHYGQRNVWILISHHADGQFITEVTGRLGFRAVRGSSTRGGVKAVRGMVELGKSDHLAITPDGPRGPRRQVQPGLIYTAARTGLPIVLAGIAFRRCWRARSWDRFALPYPCTRAICISSPLLHIPADIDREKMEGYRAEVEQKLQAIQQMAEDWAMSGKMGEIPAVLKDACLDPLQEPRAQAS
jgi:lysophospholipid acyltransferase (LPLAT)-like uncharacterized protein